MNSPLAGLLALAVFTLAAFLTGRGAVRLVRRAGRWWHAALPPLLTAASGAAVAYLLWPSYFAAPAALLWWACAFYGNIAGWFCRGRHA